MARSNIDVRSTHRHLNVANNVCVMGQAMLELSGSRDRVRPRAPVARLGNVELHARIGGLTLRRRLRRPADAATRHITGGQHGVRPMRSPCAR